MWKNYEDIINMEHHTSKVHPRMSKADRGAQFSAFAALTGYGDAINETERLTEERIEPAEQRVKEINECLLNIKDSIKNTPIATITFFVKDKYKSGGKYKTVTKGVKKIDEYERKILLTDNEKICIDDIYDIKIERE